MNSPALRRILLDLFCAAAEDPVPQLAALTDSDWAALDVMAAQHRIGPLLHLRHRDRPGVPEAIRESWRMAHRHASMAAMVQKAELAECVSLLETAGFEPIALKGAWLAWHAYPDASMRPMRDIDLLVTPETILPAFETLLAAGYVPGGEQEMALADIVRLEKHLPPLIAPRGTLIELHHRLWEPDGRLDHFTPEGNEDAMRARAVRTGGVSFPAPQDMLAQLIIHAVYSHRLDCGPLVLADLHYLLAGSSIDWPEFWMRASREGWRDGARLMLELARLFLGTSAFFDFPDGGQPPAALLAAAPDLLLQDLETRQSAAVIAAARTGGMSTIFRRLTGKRISQAGDTAQRDMASEGGFLGWAWSRTRRTLGELASGEVRRQSRDLALLSRWLGH